MKKRLRAPKALVGKKTGAAIPAAGGKLLFMRFGLATLAVLLFSVIGAAATNNFYHGHVVVTQGQTKIKPASQSAVATKATKPPARAQSATSSKPSDLVAKYGELAKSPLIAAAISKYEMGSDRLIAAKFGARLSAERSEALQHGYMKPGTSQTEILMAGYVPPGMSQEQAAFLYAHLPHTPMMPQPMTPERIARMAGEPLQAMMQEQGLSGTQIRAENNRMIESYTRERFGPIYTPPLHRAHSVSDNQLSLIDPQYTFDGATPGGSISEMTDGSGNIMSQYSYDPFGIQTKIAGTGPDADFGYAGYYVHQPSGLLLTQTRAYSPTLGRFISRDPIGEAGGTNLYAYVQNNPISYYDPTGLILETGSGQLGPTGSFGPVPSSPGSQCCWEKCKSKLPIVGPLLWGAGQPYLPAPGKVGGATPGTSPASVAGRALFGSGGKYWAPTQWPFNQYSGAGGAVGRWVPIVGAGIAAWEYANFLNCIQDCNNGK